MKNKAMETRLTDELRTFIASRRTLLLSTLDENNHPYASYAPYALGENCIYVLLSDIALHGINLKNTPKAGILIIEDEQEAQTIFARVRVNYQVTSTLIPINAGAEYDTAINCLYQKQGERIHNLRKLTDFNVFKLTPIGGRFVKDFGRAYAITGNTLVGESIDHLKDGHKPRSSVINNLPSLNEGKQ
ncbi:MAG: putative heme iron utilization protein [Pseudohongiellaceae bacterium]|jgi:putative heme iron utilization protein